MFKWLQQKKISSSRNNNLEKQSDNELVIIFLQVKYLFPLKTEKFIGKPLDLNKTPVTPLFLIDHNPMLPKFFNLFKITIFESKILYKSDIFLNILSFKNNRFEKKILCLIFVTLKFKCILDPKFFSKKILIDSLISNTHKNNDTAPISIIPADIHSK